MKAIWWYSALFVLMVVGVTWLVFPGPRELATIYSQDNKIDKAMAMLTDQLAKSPDDPDLNQSMAGLLYDAGRVDQAIAYLERVLALRPERVDQLLRLADWREGLYQTAEVVKDLEAALKRLPPADVRKPESVVLRRDLLIRLLDIYIYQDDAEAQYATVLRLLPLDAVVRAGIVAGCAPLRSAVAELKRMADASRDQAADPVFRENFLEAYGLCRMLADDIVDDQGGPAREATFLADLMELLVRGEMQDAAARIAQAADAGTGGVTARLALARTFSS
ncbi:MAG: tetratricopeptide repeat protein, partial [Desulfovibrionaceae bacterium]